MADAPSSSDPDLWAPDVDVDPRDVIEDPEPDVDGEPENECEVCHGPCPADQVVCDDCEGLIDEMRIEELLND
jgi:hypothetical protein